MLMLMLMLMKSFDHQRLENFKVGTRMISEVDTFLTFVLQIRGWPLFLKVQVKSGVVEKGINFLKASAYLLESRQFSLISVPWIVLTCIQGYNDDGQCQRCC